MNNKKTRKNGAYCIISRHDCNKMPYAHFVSVWCVRSLVNRSSNYQGKRCKKNDQRCIEKELTDFWFGIAFRLK